jgi:hypothetical protein
MSGTSPRPARPDRTSRDAARTPAGERSDPAGVLVSAWSAGL